MAHEHRSAGSVATSPAAPHPNWAHTRYATHWPALLLRRPRWSPLLAGPLSAASSGTDFDDAAAGLPMTHPTFRLQKEQYMSHTATQRAAVVGAGAIGLSIASA